MNFDMESAAAILGTIQCPSGFRKDCMKGSKCKLWHKGEPTNQERGTKTYLLRKTVNRHEQNQLSPRIAASRRKRTNNQPTKTKESNANKQSEDAEIESNESIWVPQSNS